MTLHDFYADEPELFDRIAETVTCDGCDSSVRIEGGFKYAVDSLDIEHECNPNQQGMVDY